MKKNISERLANLLTNNKQSILPSYADEKHIKGNKPLSGFHEWADGPYIRFCNKIRLLAKRINNCVPVPDGRSLLKRIDKYNYSKYTMHWI